MIRWQILNYLKFTQYSPIFDDGFTPFHRVLPLGYVCHSRLWLWPWAALPDTLPCGPCVRRAEAAVWKGLANDFLEILGSARVGKSSGLIFVLMIYL